MKNRVVQSDQMVQRVARKFYYMIPLYLLVPLIIGVFFHKMFASIDWLAFGLGALGWIMALMMRGPLATLVKNVSPEKAAIIMGLSSGPFEEGIRVGLLLLTGLAFQWALSVGQGWAAAEVLFVVINGIAQVKLLQSDHKKAAEAREVLEKQGFINVHPFLGVIERVSASFFHIGATLLVAKMPVMVFVLLFAHSLLNIVAVVLSRKYMILTQIWLLMVGTFFLICGFSVF